MTISDKRKILLKFYSACVLSSWGDRTWFFALSIYFITINKDSLFITAVNGLVSNLFLICLAPLLGSLIDKYQRINVVRISLFIQNSTVALNCCLIVMIMIFRESFVDRLWNGHFLYFCQAIIIIINCVSNASSMANKISIEKDWVIVVAQHSYSEDENKDKKIDKTLLASMNATVRRFDLLTAILAPLLAGLIMSFLKINPSFNGTVMSAIIFAVWNLVSFFIEYYLLASVYNDIPELKKKNAKIYNNENEQNNSKIPTKNLKQKAIDSINTILNGWKVYMTQGLILLPSLVLAILYLTVLSFDSITLGYAKSRKLTETFISILQGLGSLFGILGTVAFPIMHNSLHINLKTIGLISFTMQLSFLFICLISVFLPGSPFVLSNKLFSTYVNYCENSTNLTVNQTLLPPRELTKFESFFFESPCFKYLSIISLLTAMAISRFGLWLTDLVIHQMIQENVEEDKRGIIGGVQNSMNKIFDTLKYFCVILFSEITQYGYLVILSVTAVLISYFFYIGYVISTTIKKKYHQVPQNELQVIKSNEQENKPNEQITISALET